MAVGRIGRDRRITGLVAAFGGMRGLVRSRLRSVDRTNQAPGIRALVRLNPATRWVRQLRSPGACGLSEPGSGSPQLRRSPAGGRLGDHGMVGRARRGDHAVARVVALRRPTAADERPVTRPSEYRSVCYLLGRAY